MQNNKKLVEKYTKLISDSDKMRIDKDKASENQGIGKNLTKERSNTSSLIKIGQSPSKSPSILNHSPSPSSYGSIKQTMVNNQNARNPTSVYNKEKIKVASSRTPKILTPEQQAKYDAAEAAAVKASGGRGLVIFKNPNLPEAPPKYNSDQSGDSDGETKITQNNKKLVEKYIKLISEEGGGFLETLGVPSWLDPTTLVKRVTDKLGWTGTPTTKSPNGGGGFDGGAGNQSSGNFGVGGGSQNGGGGTREDRKRAMRDDQSVTDYEKMLNRASGKRDARLAKIDARREFLKTPEGQAELKKQRGAENDRQRAANSPEGRAARVKRMGKLAQDAEDMKTANAKEKAAMDNDPATKKLRADAEARTAARANADRGGTDQRGAASGEFTMRGGQVVRSSDEHYDNVQNANATGEWIDPNSPGGRVIGQERRAAVDDQRDQHGPKNIETARAEIRRDSARLEAEMRAAEKANPTTKYGDIPTPQEIENDEVSRRLGAPPAKKPQPLRPFTSTREDNPFDPPLDAEARDNFADMKKKLNPSLHPNPLVRRPDGSVEPVSPSAPGMQSGRPQFVGPEDKPTNTNVASLLRPKTSPKTSGPQDKPDYGVPPGIARPSNVPRGVSPPPVRDNERQNSNGVPSLLGRPQPEPPDNTPIDAQGQQNLQNIKRALNPNTRPSPNERPSPNAGDQPFLGKPSSGLTRLANIPIQVKPGDRRRISASQLAREAQSRRA